MVFPWMFEEIGCLQPMKAAAELLATRTDWPNLYDLGTLHSLNVPVAAACYFEDMCVPPPGAVLLCLPGPASAATHQATTCSASIV